MSREFNHFTLSDGMNPGRPKHSKKEMASCLTIQFKDEIKRGTDNEHE